MAKEPKPAPDTSKEPQAAASFSDVAKDVTVNFVKAKDLAEMGTFNLIGATKRKAMGRFPDSINFEVQFREGEMTGTTAIVTLRDTPVRSRWASVVESRGSVGALMLVKGTASKEPGSSAPWVFASPEMVASGELPHDPNAADAEKD